MDSVFGQYLHGMIGNFWLSSYYLSGQTTINYGYKKIRKMNYDYPQVIEEPIWKSLPLVVGIIILMVGVISLGIVMEIILLLKTLFKKKYK